MTRDIDTLVRYLLVVVFIAAICSTAVPILYSTGPWRAKLLGRLFMLQAVSFAAAVDVTVLFQFWHPKDILWVFWIEAIIFTMIAVSTSALAWMSWRVNHPKGKRRRSRMLFNEGTYNKLKFITQILLPAIGTFYVTIAAILSLPYANQVGGIILAIVTFLGTLLGISTKAYNNSTLKYDGAMVVTNDPEAGLSMKFASFDPQLLISKSELTFKVKQE